MFRPFVLSIGLVSLLVSACTLSFATRSTDSEGEDAGPPAPEAPFAIDAQTPPSADAWSPRDAQASPDTRSDTNPLCGALACGLPDEVRSDRCGVTSRDKACRVRTVDGGVGSVCSTAGSGVDGAPCLKGSDCGSGYECVGKGECRRYCCAGALTCGGKQYCEPQPVYEATSLLVPVCTDVQACKLMDAYACGDGRQCAVLATNGTTTCVDVGSALEGQSCENERCGAGLTCLGSSGQKECFRLCSMGDPKGCGVGQECRTTSSLFQDTTVGVCVGTEKRTRKG